MPGADRAEMLPRCSRAAVLVNSVRHLRAFESCLSPQLAALPGPLEQLFQYLNSLANQKNKLVSVTWQAQQWPQAAPGIITPLSASGLNNTTGELKFEQGNSYRTLYLAEPRSCSSARGPNH
eukprot:87586-Hanusia_phi.AAC.1